MMSDVKYLLFLGCYIPYRVSSYEISTRKILEMLNVEVVEMPEFNCCGFPLNPVNRELALTMAARTLCLAEQQNLNIMALCNGCFGILNEANRSLKEDENIRWKVNDHLGKIGMEFKGTIEVKHLIHVLTQDVGLEKIKKAIQKPLNELEVAQHTGCHVMRPREGVGYEDPENPTILKNLIEVTGAKCLDYLDEPECCGAPIIGINEQISLQLAKEKLDHIKAVGAQALVTICPFCHMIYDLNQPRIERMFGETFGIPILHYSQLLGLAMGLDPKELAMEELRVNASKILSVAGFKGKP